MLNKIAAHFRANIVGYLALVIASGGTAWAAASIGSAEVIDNSLRSVDLRNNAAVRSVDVTDDTSVNGGLQGIDIRADAIGFSELAASTFNADIIEQGNVFGIPNDGIQGYEVQDGSLGGADIDETSLMGVVRTRGGASCCTLRGGILYTEDPYSPDDPGTFIHLGNFELRSTDAGDADKVRFCNPNGVNFSASYIVYTGGQHASPGETRSRSAFPSRGNCHTIDVNGTDSASSGDFRMWVLERAWEAMQVQGASFATGTGFTIYALSLS